MHHLAHVQLSAACKQQCTHGAVRARTTSLTVGTLARQGSSVGSSGAETATAASSAWLQMYCTASGPSVSYSGTVTIEYA